MKLNGVEHEKTVESVKIMIRKYLNISEYDEEDNDEPAKKKMPTY